ncbi:hypothetical protein [Deinococcus enclensis]|uniref:PH domain-containing protein n=1 Tax=Deinococcus enclensis TaxID=1049582 RepID=A0ABT9MG56_9DEIO|nr:hypothetical protein [Deinococcus enclensis]MDP9765535.1 hypothetical protein [Deinococcus enclensis]
MNVQAPSRLPTWAGLGLGLSVLIPAGLTLLARTGHLADGAVLALSTAAAFTVTIAFHRTGPRPVGPWLVSSYLKAAGLLTLLHPGHTLPLLNASATVVLGAFILTGLVRPLPQNYRALSDLERCYAFFGRFTTNPRVLNLALYDLFLFWQVVRPSPVPPATHRAEPPSGGALTLVAVYFGVPLETLLQHVLVAQVSEPLAWGLTACAAYFLLWYAAYMAALRCRGTFIRRGRLYGCVGAHWTFSTDLTNVRSAGPHDPERHAGALDLTLKAAPNLTLEFQDPVQVLGVFGMTKVATAVTLSAATPGDLVRELRAAQALPALEGQVTDQASDGCPQAPRDQGPAHPHAITEVRA